MSDVPYYVWWVLFFVWIVGLVFFLKAKDNP